jgi:hypothetical protein
MYPRRRVNVIAVVFALVAGLCFAQSQPHHYGLQYDLTLKPEDERAEVAIILDQRVKERQSLVDAISNRSAASCRI